jgi:aromatic-amino-acid transaminase
VHTYPYFDQATRGVDFDGMLATLQTLPANSVVLLHPCCHNPTGADLDQHQWQQVVEVVKARQLIPFLDIAYQGFGEGLVEDAYAIREMARAGVPCLVSNSFSKIFSLYGERVGACRWCATTRPPPRACLASSRPPCAATTPARPLRRPAGGRRAGDAGLNAQWAEEVEVMRKRILDMRQAWSMLASCCRARTSSSSCASAACSATPASASSRCVACVTSSACT